MSCAASRNLNAFVLGRAPRESIITNTFSSLTIVIVGACSRNVVASVGRSTTRSSSFKSQTGSTVIITQTARRDSSTRLGRRAPGRTARTNTLSSGAVVIRWADDRNCVTFIGIRAPSGIRLEGEAFAAIVMSGTTAWDSYTFRL